MFRHTQKVQTTSRNPNRGDFLQHADQPERYPKLNSHTPTYKPTTTSSCALAHCGTPLRTTLDGRETKGAPRGCCSCAPSQYTARDLHDARAADLTLLPYAVSQCAEMERTRHTSTFCSKPH
eukprot:4275692-Pyramimonas_sp.AAC.1